MAPAFYLTPFSTAHLKESEEHCICVGGLMQVCEITESKGMCEAKLVEERVVVKPADAISEQGG